MSTAATDQRITAGRLATLVFAALALATVGAFFVTQRLKRSAPAVKRITTQLYVSPNCDGRKDTARLSFDLPKGDHVTVSILNSVGDEVRRIMNDRRLGKGTHVLHWDGRDSSGHVPPDGLYFVRVILSDQARAATSRRGIRLLVTPPRPRIVAVTPQSHAPGRATPVTVRYSGPANPPASFSVYRTDQPGPARLVASFKGHFFSNAGQWDGLVGGRPAPPGDYAFAVTVENKALVAGSAPPRLPPTAAEAPPHTGLTIAGFQASAPLEPVAAGSAADLPTSAPAGPVRWTLERAGAGKPIARGVSHATTVHMGVPGKAASGLYLVRLHAGAGTAVLPLAVRGRGAGAPVLVILPSITWQGSNRIDDDANGFADTLDVSRSVPLARPFAFGRPPPGVTGEAAPLLAFLDRQKLRYDLTTDLALARGHGPPLSGHRAVVLAGSERWLPTGVQGLLRGFVTAGGRLASFGTDALRRSVALGSAALSAPTQPARSNALGERTAETASVAAPLVVFGDTLGVFSNTNAYVGLFTRFEQSVALPRGVTPVVAAGRDQRHPAFVAYRLGRGLVLRTGTPEWAAQLGDPQVASTTSQLWALLSR